jgi:hypothetical protein
MSQARMPCYGVMGTWLIAAFCPVWVKLGTRITRPIESASPSIADIPNPTLCESMLLLRAALE